MFTQEAPPLIPALTSGRYHIKWTQLANLPVPLYGAYVVVQDKKVYITGGESPVEGAKHQVYVYDINTDQWGQLPLSGHYYGIPHIIGRKLAIIGGRLSTTKKRTNKVSTFDEDSQIWTSYYPNLLSVRSRPGVVSHLEHVIVAGGTRPTAKDDETMVVQDNIEVLNWIENSHWRKVSIKLPVPMFGFTPTISDDHLLIVGYNLDESHNDSYKIPVANITASNGQKHQWNKLTATAHFKVAPISGSSPPVVVGGQGSGRDGCIPTAVISMYNNCNKSWMNIGSLSSARSYVGVVTVHNNSIIVIGGCTKVRTMADRELSSLTIVELGHAELLC